MEDLYKNFAEELGERKLAKNTAGAENRERKISQLAEHHTINETGVSPNDQKALSNHGENSWFATHGKHENRFASMSDAEIYMHHKKLFGNKTVKKGEDDQMKSTTGEQGTKKPEKKEPVKKGDKDTKSKFSGKTQKEIAADTLKAGKVFGKEHTPEIKANLKAMSKSELVDELFKAGFRESALLLSNWDEMDTIAKSMKMDFDKDGKLNEHEKHHKDLEGHHKKT